MSGIQRYCTRKHTIAHLTVDCSGSISSVANRWTARCGCRTFSTTSGQQHAECSPNSAHYSCRHQAPCPDPGHWQNLQRGAAPLSLIVLRTFFQSVAVFRYKPRTFCGWSGRLEQSPTAHSYGTYIINFQKHAQETSILSFLLHWLTVSQSMSSEHCTAPF